MVIEELLEDDDVGMAQSPTLKSPSRFSKRPMPEHLRRMNPSPSFGTETGTNMLTSSVELAKDDTDGENGIFEFSHSQAQSPYRASFGDYMLTDDAMAFQNTQYSANGGLRSSFSPHRSTTFHSSTNGGYFPSHSQSSYTEPSDSATPSETQADYENPQFRTSPHPASLSFTGIMQIRT